MNKVNVKTIVERLADKAPRVDSSVLEKYLSEIVEWNPRVGMVSKLTTAAVLERLVAESAQLIDIISDNWHGAFAGRGFRVVDIGTGAGFPGIIWKMVHPDIELTLVERKSKKAAFLERVVIVLGLKDVEVVESDAREAASQQKYKGIFDLAVSLAVGPTETLARAVATFLRPRGYYCSVRPLEETRQPERIDTKLILRSAVPLKFGIFCMYQLDE